MHCLRGAARSSNFMKHNWKTIEAPEELDAFVLPTSKWP